MLYECCQDQVVDADLFLNISYIFFKQKKKKP